MRGLHEYRFEQNPEEKRIAKEFKGYAKRNLKYLLHVGNQDGFVPDPSGRDKAVACTIIQWLGSPVGQGFLEKLGYYKK